MEIFVIFTYLLFSILLFIILTYLNKKYNLTLVEYITSSLIYIFIAANIYSNNSTIYIVSIFLFVIDLIYTTYIKEENFFRYKNRFKMYIILIILSIILNLKIINKTNTLLDIKDLKLIIWLLIVLFIYNFYKNKDIKYTSYKVDDNKSNLNDKEYIVMMFAKMKNKYNIDTNKYLVNIVYAGMIYLNYLRPDFLRKIDLLKFKLDNKKRKLGIMQIESNKEISDFESIEIAVKEIEKIYDKLVKKKTKKSEIDKEIIKLYYKGYDIDKIKEIYQVINNFIKY